MRLYDGGLLVLALASMVMVVLLVILADSPEIRAAKAKAIERCATETPVPDYCKNLIK